MVIAIKHALGDLVDAGARGHADGLHSSKVAAVVALRAALATRHRRDEGCKRCCDLRPRRSRRALPSRFRM
jgi:hypothetical protein